MKFSVELFAWFIVAVYLVNLMPDSTAVNDDQLFTDGRV